MPSSSRIIVPEVPVLVVGTRGAVLFSPDGRLEEMAADAAGQRISSLHPIVCHSRATAVRLKVAPFPAHDILELFAFARPAHFCLPTVRGLADGLGFERPEGLKEEALVLVAVVRRLLWQLANLTSREQADARSVAWAMARGGWLWETAVLGALGVTGDRPHRVSVAAGLRVWDRMPRWEDQAAEPRPGNTPVNPADARHRLAELLGPRAEERPQQADYASAVTAAFQPREQPGAPTMVLAEAGTGVGKTLGYIAAASVWAQKNKGTVWISTYTRTLQRQLDAELDRLFPDPEEKARKVVVRKGRENYLCLLNMEEAIHRLGGRPFDAVALGLMARWALGSRDGDMSGAEFPGWLVELCGRELTLGLADRRGECIYSACFHYQRCPIERNVRRARRAEIVVANHALVMVHAALGALVGPGPEDTAPPTRYVFDEGHHVFEAADSAFAAHLSGRETAELRIWLLGNEQEGARSRARGLKARAADLAEGDETLAAALDEVHAAARILPGPGWHQRLAGDAPHGALEKFLVLVRTQVTARAENSAGSPYGLETGTEAPVAGLMAAAVALDAAFLRLAEPLAALCAVLLRRLDDEAAQLDSEQRARIEGIARSIQRRAVLPIGAWRAMVQSVGHATPPEFVDWFGIDRINGREVDIGMHRHWIDPTRPFALSIADSTHGLLVTSATLRDASGDVEADWLAAERRTGADHLPLKPVRASVPSPFDYAGVTRVMVVTDVRRDNLDQVAAAYRELFLAAGGGALGLFTAVSRLRAVYERIAGPLDTAGVQLLAQHVDAMDTGTLVDIFRAEEDACLLGTDAVRDGVDVPGRSLRLIVFDRVPWPRPDLLHKARRAAFSAAGGRGFDDTITRLRLKQAYGRLIRRAGDVGVFVMLDPMMPSRLNGAFPDGVEVLHLGLKDAILETRRFLRDGTGRGGSLE
ncbi:MAG: ATP-dependent DNA helicase [Alphaproteobacteria bacterium]|nr:ATP-dependent DNA helicase [Alphaproteobacteria bacterium]